MADRVVKALRHPGWGLVLQKEVSYADLSGLNCDVDSAWAPLASSLEVTAQGGRIDPHLFATGCWDGYMAPVAGVAAKVHALTRSIPAEVNATIFVPGENVDEARTASDGRLRIRSYKRTHSQGASEDTVVCMHEHLALLEVPPMAGSALEERLAYSNRAYLLRSPKRDQYYRSHLLPDLAERVRKALVVRPTRVAFSMGKTSVLPSLLLRALSPCQARVLVTSQTAESFASLEKEISDCQMEALAYSTECEVTLVEEIARWLSGPEQSGGGAVEITGGTKAMTAVLIAAAQRAQASIYYLRHETIRRAPKYGTERLTSLSWLSAHVN